MSDAVEELSLEAPENWVFQRKVPKAAEALAAVCDLEVETLEQMLATPDWRYTETNGFEWKEPAPKVQGKGKKLPALPTLRWTGPLRKRLMNALEAWETLASRGVIPDHWVGDSGRRFHGAWRNASPPSLWSAVAYACDPEALSTVETLGREVAHRLAPWYQPHHQQVLWRIASRDELSYYPRVALIPGGDVLHAAARALPEARAILEVTPPPARRPRGRAAQPSVALPWDNPALPRVVRAVSRLIAIADLWRRSRAEALDMAVAVRVGDLPDPWEPLMKLWRMGYGLDLVSRRSVTLIVPGLV